MGVKRFFLLFVMISLLMPTASVQTLRQPAPKKHKIVIDPGHGGNDPGAVGKISKEKDIVLSIALKLGNLIEQSYDDIEVVYTRKTDVFVELFRRAKIANQNQAELFISLHCNASKNKSAYGSETWVMGLHKSEENLAVAKKENAAILLEDDYLSQYDGFDPNSPEANAIFSLYQNAFLEQSLLFATSTQKQFKNFLGRHDRGVKQAGFLVLYRTTMPGVLIEAGFISNEEEEKYIASEKGQNNIAKAIFNAFAQYWLSVNGKQSNTVVNIEPPDEINNNEIEDVMPIEPLYSNTNEISNKFINNNNDTIVFKVQFASSSIQKPLNSPDFKKLDNVGVYLHQGAYKYTAGYAATLEEAILVQKDVVNKGYKDAFVVAFKNNVRISPAEATRLLKKD